MKKVLLTVLFAVTLLLTAGLAGSESVEAATKYTTIKNDLSQDFTGDGFTIHTDAYFETIQLRSKKNAYKKINAFLKDLCDSYTSTVNEIAEQNLDYLENDDTYSDFYKTSVLYDDGQKISIGIYNEYYAGGVCNTDLKCYTFSLKTGKQLSVKKITGLSLKSLNKKILKAAYAADLFDEDDTFAVNNTKETLASMKSTDYSFYIIDKDTICVTFGAYSLGYGGWYKELIINY